MIKVLELFSGYGGASFALTKAGIEHKVIGYSDIEKCANYIYALNHGEDIPALGDITKINPDDLEDFDLLTGGFPCQSFSMAGNRQGFEAVNKGKLFFDIIRIAKVKTPRWMLLENVQGLISHDNGNTLKIVLDELKLAGYYVQWKLLFSKEHGTPQNRPRVWFACFRKKEDYNKFIFPEKEELNINVKDLLEDEVDEKYYLNEKQLEIFNKSNRYGNHSLNYGDDIHPTLCSIDKSDVAIIPEDFKIADFRYDEGIRLRNNGLCPTLTSTNRGNGLSGQPIVMSLQPRSINRPSMQNAIKEGKPLPGGHGTLTRNDGVSYTLDTSAGQAIKLNKNGVD